MAPSDQSLTREQVRRLDRRAIETWGVSGLVLMENAGRQAADAFEGYMGGAASKRVAVVAGAGNNGGDGFVIARHLHLRGAEVAVFIVANRAKLTADAGANLAILERLGLDVRDCAGSELDELAGELGAFDLVVDAVGGTGITGPLRGVAATAVRQINASLRPVVAVDIPTGLDCDSGQAHDPTVRAQLTVTFAARKVGFDAPGAADYTGRVVVADIGVPLRPDVD